MTIYRYLCLVFKVLSIMAVIESAFETNYYLDSASNTVYKITAWYADGVLNVMFEVRAFACNVDVVST